MIFLIKIRPWSQGESTGKGTADHGLAIEHVRDPIRHIIEGTMDGGPRTNPTNIKDIMSTRTHLVVVITIVIMEDETLGVDREVGNIEIETDTETMNHTDRIIDEAETDDRVVVQDGRGNQKRENCMKETGHIVRMIGTVSIGMKF